MDLFRQNKRGLLSAAIAAVITASYLEYWKWNRTSNLFISATAAWIFYDNSKKKRASKAGEKERHEIPGCEYTYVDIQAKDSEGGVRKYSKLLRENPKDATSLLKRGVCYSNLNKHAEAIADFDAALEINPGDKSAISYRAASIGAAGDVQGSVEGFKQLLVLDPSDYNALASIGMILPSLGQFEAALPYLDKALEIYSGEAGLFTARGICNYHTEENSKAISDLNESIKRGFKNVVATYYLAMAQEYADNRNEALEILSKEITRRGDSGTDLLYTARARIYLAAENYSESIRDASAALKQNPGDKDTLRIRGTALRIQENYEEAIEDFSAVIKQSPKDVAALTSRGDCKEKLKKTAEALDDYILASSLKPEDASIWQRIGNANKGMGRTEEAIKAYTKRIELNGDDDAGYINRGDQYLELKDYKKAASDFTIAIGKNPGNIQCIYARAYSYIHLSEYRLAEKDLSRCVAARPEKVMFYEMRAIVRRELGDIDGCRTDKNQANYMRGTEKMSSGDAEGAFEEWTEAALNGSDEAEKLLRENEHLRERAESEGLKRKLLKAVYTEELFLQFGCFSATVSPQEEMEPMGEIYKRLSEYKVEELIDDADIDASTFHAEHPQHSIENYIRSYGFDKPWENREIMPNIENIIKYEILLYVSAAIENKSCEPRKWHKYAESIWEELMHLLGGERNMKGIAVATTEENQTLISELFNAITSKQALSDWAYGIKDAYTRLKKKVLISTQYEGGKGIDNDWTIYRAEESKAQYFGDLLNKRVLDLWQYTSWGQNGEKPVQYLRSNDANGVCVSWCSPDVDLEKERGTESCYYFVSDDGVAVVREFNEYLLLANEQHLHAAALTIIKDVMGDFEFDLVTNAFLKDTLGEELWEKIQSKERVFSPADLVPEYSIGQLRQAVINDYAYLCYQDGGTQPDERSLEDFKKKVAKMSWDELLKETSISEDVNPSLDFSLRDYIESWLAKSEYADLIYIKNEDGSTTIET